MSKLSVVTINGVTFAADFDSDSGKPIYVANRPFMYEIAYIEVLEFDAFWRWALCQSDVSFTLFSEPGI